ncbi:arginyl-tRNA--protein transferase 1-like isoform X2 [Physella acuta]|uniref:arginyl-tRNA--protein transferase 1-like isoform X2 n=1 Tax=Physella acuta TaxID=109671 RepID=UPI0027DC50FE|nr:arginyl-tRNA--protein transferase 1-like isoform X2 [Physella acuta]
MLYPRLITLPLRFEMKSKQTHTLVAMSLDEEPTIAEYFSEHERYRCGYCGSQDTNYSHGMWAHQMTVQDYQDLIDRGWRRSGKYCYKPTMNVTCCPQYTIRCDALNFKLNKSHKKLIKRVNRYLITGVKGAHDVTGRKQEDGSGDEQGGHKGVEVSLAEKAKPSEMVMPNNFTKMGEAADTSKSNTSVASDTVEGSSSAHSKVSSYSSKSIRSCTSTEKHIPRPGTGPDPNKPRCRKAKDIRAEKRSHKDRQKDEDVKNEGKKHRQEKSLEELLSEPDKVEHPAHKLEIVLCAPESPRFRLTFQDSYYLYKKYQMLIHKDPPEDCEKKGFKNFLADSPLEEKHEPTGPPEGYGSFHQHYLLDGKLIAVGVIDILPACVSSVYLYYDPDYSFLGLGVYSALRELALVRSLNHYAPNLKYYYMGFYIHSCPKMRYKGQFVPSYLACPETYQWVPIETCRPKLDASKYSRLSEEGLEDKNKDIDVDQVLVLHKGTMLPYSFYKSKKSRGSDEDEVKEYATYVGKTCAQRMLLVRK